MRNVMSDECLMEKEAYFLLKERRRPHFPQNCGKNPTYQYVCVMERYVFQNIYASKDEICM